MKKINIFYLFIFLISCEQDEIPIIKREIGSVISKQINMGSNYSQQVYYKIKENIIVSENEKTKWDLAFENTTQGWKIITNSATFSQIALVNSDFSDNVNINSLNWSWDRPEGINHGTAIGDYRYKNNVYVIDRGYNLNGSTRGYRKFMIDSINSNLYIIKYANLDNTNLQSLTIIKDEIFNFKYLTFDNDETISIEPLKEEWDLLFTQYTHLYLENTEPPAYLVTGVLTNYLNNIMVARDTINKFIDINLNMIDQYNFTNNQNEIGYNWKTYNFTSQNYIVNSEITYIISTSNGRYFKLHFIDFYNDNGEKGNPKFEIQEL